jgi:hypothetical protein
MHTYAAKIHYLGLTVHPDAMYVRMHIYMHINTFIRCCLFERMVHVHAYIRDAHT